jgi:prepilin-type N-terminal cleavage/methylation domain-containing protein
MTFHHSSIPSFHYSTRSAGFTLLELLIALALMGILTASVAGVLANTADSIDSGNESVRQQSRLRSLDLLLGAALREAVLVELTASETRMLADSFSYSDDDGNLRFRGEETALGFCLQRPFLEAERDGYMHWVLLEIRTDEESGAQSLWLKDVSFLEEIDNPVGEDYGGLGLLPEECLPVREVCLIRSAQRLVFSYWRQSEEDSYDEDEEVEPDELAGDYAFAAPDYVLFDMKMPHMQAEQLTLDVAVLEVEL